MTALPRIPTKNNGLVTYPIAAGRTGSHISLEKSGQEFPTAIWQLQDSLPGKATRMSQASVRMQTFVMTGVRQGSVQELHRFAPASGEVVVRSRAVAICTTERRIFSGDVAVPFPVIGGHEVSGTVVDAADNDCGLQPGDRVVLDAVNRCGGCSNCIRGQSQLCDRRYDTRRRGYQIVGGGFAQFVTIPARRLFRWSGPASPEEVALTEPLACCVHSIERGCVRSGDTVAILGAGTMGLLHLLLSRMRGAETLVLDRDGVRLHLAQRLGADCTIDISREDGIAAVKRRTGGRGADAAFVAASARSAGETALRLVAKSGRVVLFASTHPPEILPVPWNVLHDREMTLEGAVGKTAKDFRAALALISNGSVDLKPLVSRVIPLSELAGELLRTPAGAVQRVVVRHADP